MTAVGQMDRRVTIEQRTETRPASKAPVETWATLAVVSMAIVSQKKRLEGERFTANQMSARQNTVWHTPYRSDLDPEIVSVPRDRRLLYRGRYYDILDATQLLDSTHIIELTTTAKVDA